MFFCHFKDTITRQAYIYVSINLPVVYMVRDEMIFRLANPLQGPLEGFGPENRDLFGP
jgi:hypothetical protein